MLEFTVTNGFGHIRFIRPLVDESEQDFRRRMDAMAQVLAEQAPNLIAVIMMDGDGCPVCIVSHRSAPPPQS
jgi:hypothetical protein